MRSAVADTQPWICASATLSGSGRPCKIRINIRCNSLSRSFLILEDETTKLFCFIPVSAEISASYSGQTLVLSFSRYEAISVTFLVQDYLQLELLISHLGKSSLLFNNQEDVYKKENLQFLHSLSTSSHEIDSPLREDAGESTILLPIVLSKTAKEIWEKGVMEQNYHFFMKPHTLKISFLTWNVASKHPLDETKEEFARVFRGPVSAADLVIIAMEEVEMSVKSVVTGSSNYRERWAEIILSASSSSSSPSETSDYDLVCVECVGTVLIACLIKKSLKSIIKPEKPQIIKLGAGGLLANKAAILLPILAGEAKITVVSCHLTAHEPNFEERNQQIKEILDTIGDKVDYLFFCGDLNYRVAIPYEETIDLCKKKKVAQLLSKDQLKMIQAKDKRIRELIEPDILFLPTYKFDKNSDIYDTSSKKRVPSYTDRILYRTGSPRLHIGNDQYVIFESDAAKHFMHQQSLFSTDCNSNIHIPTLNYPAEPNCICYRSLHSRFSDHRPVHALYKLTIPVIEQSSVEEFQQIVSEKYQELKRLSKPTISVEPSTIVCNSTSMDVIVQNKSLVWAHWSIKLASGELRVSPAAGTLISGESVVIKVTLGDLFVPATSFFTIGLKDGPETTIDFTEQPDIVSIPVEIGIQSNNSIENTYVSLPVYENHFASLDSIDSPLSFMNPADDDGSLVVPIDPYDDDDDDILKQKDDQNDNSSDTLFQKQEEGESNEAGCDVALLVDELESGEK